MNINNIQTQSINHIHLEFNRYNTRFAIPGGSEEIMLDLGIRQAMSVYQTLKGGKKKSTLWIQMRLSCLVYRMIWFCIIALWDTIIHCICSTHYYLIFSLFILSIVQYNTVYSLLEGVVISDRIMPIHVLSFISTRICIWQGIEHNLLGWWRPA